MFDQLPTKAYRIICLFFIFSASQPLAAGEKVDQTLTVEGALEFQLSYQRGKVAIVGWEQNKIKIKGELDDKAKTFVFKKKGRAIVATIVSQAPNSYITPGRATNLTVYLPTNMFVRVTTITGALALSKLEGGIHVNLDSGEIQAKEIKKSIDIVSVGSNITLRNIDAQVNITSVSGTIIIHGVSPKLFVKSVYSNIDVNLSTITFCKIATVSGNINLTGRLAKNGEIALNNTSGNSTYFAESQLDARVRLETGPGGDILNQYSKDKPTRGITGAGKLIYSLGSAAGKVYMTTQNGRLIVKNNSKKR